MDVTITELREKYPQRFQKELEDYSSDGMSDNYWSHCVIDDWIERLDKLGVDCTRDGVNWSGFWCRGDGASFTGRVSMRKFWEAHGAPADYLVAAEFLRNGEVFEYCEITRRDYRYCHENTVGVDDTPALWTVPGLDGRLEEGVFAGGVTVTLLPDDVYEAQRLVYKLKLEAERNG